MANMIKVFGVNGTQVLTESEVNKKVVVVNFIKCY